MLKCSSTVQPDWSDFKIVNLACNTTKVQNVMQKERLLKLT